MLERERQKLLGLPHTVLHLSALGDVTGGGEQQAVLQLGRAPQQPSVRAVLAAVAVLESDHAAAGRLLRIPRGCLIEIIGMDEICERPLKHFLRRIAESPLECSIDSNEMAGVVRDRHQVQRKREEAVDVRPRLGERRLSALLRADVPSDR